MLCLSHAHHQIYHLQLVEEFLQYTNLEIDMCGICLLLCFIYHMYPARSTTFNRSQNYYNVQAWHQHVRCFCLLSCCRSRIFGLLEKHLNSKETSWMSNLHHILLRSLEPEALDHAFLSMKPQMFIAHPLPECACKMGPPSLANESQAVWRDLVSCPSWMSS